MQQSREILASLWASAGLLPEALEAVRLTGDDPALPSSFRIGAAAQTTIAAAALAAGEIWRLRSGGRQQVAVDMRDAALEFRSERHACIDGVPQREPYDRIHGLYPCAEGCWVRLHTQFPHHRDGVLRLLGCEYDRGAVRRALRAWRARDFEDAAAERGLCAAALRGFAAWDADDQGRAVAGLPLVSIEKIGNAEPQSLPSGSRPLSGVRVLDLTRVIAGPVCGRTLAAHGADVLLVARPDLPSIPLLVVDTGRGKLSTHLDLRQPHDRATLQGLLAEADIFVQGYRPGSIRALGFGPEEGARIRPGIIYVSLSAYGQAGPWAMRRGFDSLVQTASGLNHAEAEASGSDKPKPLPAQALDHGSGYLLAFGALAALYRRATEGGSWHVQVSLARTGFWLRSLGRIEGGFACPEPRHEDVCGRLEETDSGFGRLTAVRHAARMEETPVRWERPSVPLGTHPSRWPA